MDTVEEKKVSSTKLVVIDTQKRVAHSYVGTYKCGEAHLPDPNEDDYTAVEMTEQLSAFLHAADEARYRAIAAKELAEKNGKAMVEATKEYDAWFERLVRKSPV
jgi:hypothetical protein